MLVEPAALCERPDQAALQAPRRGRVDVFNRRRQRESAFTRACRALGIQHRRTKPRHAWTNGFVERLQGTILTELWRVAFRRTYYTSLGQLDRDLQAYLRFYNHERPHQGYRLRGRTPASVFLSRSAV
ncbi:MAG: integrase core domain-containing protein [Armatimonadota bacterium]|nr:integrase core domain-containing protein [Armatimonadota bacterium]MDR7533635.1 integrase core domain-containing protein [Armatimonadota bacterium]MDR7537353.1 integrase core domain-containing protein [Armatimonadota bacterium]